MSLEWCLSGFKWFRRFVGGKWVYVRIDLGERPMFWVKVNPEVSISQRFAYNHTVLETEEW